MSYIINKTSGEPLLTLQDGTLDTSTSVGLLGRNYVGYGEVQNENFLHLLENFANNNPPARPLPGQTWFNTDTNLLNVYDGINWVVVGSAQLSEEFPLNPPTGALWLKTPEKVLYIWDGIEWKFIGPETAEGFGVTRAKSTIMQDSDGILRPVVQFIVNDIILAIVSSTNFTLPASTIIPGFSNITIGINLNNLSVVNGNLTGKSQRADRLEVARKINGVAFDGTTDITIRSSTTRFLNKGNYIVGNNFDGSNETTWSVNATPNNIVGTIVARDSSGGFSAGTITGNLIGDVTGNVTATTGTSTFNTIVADRFIGATLSGNSFSATKLQTARLINNVPFDGTEDITVTASASTLTGNNLSNSIVFSNLTQVGTLTTLNVSNQGINVGTQLKLFVAQGNAIIENPLTNQSLKFQIKDASVPGVNIGVDLIPSETSQSAGGESNPSLIPALQNIFNIGHPQFKFKKIYATDFVGNFLGNSTTSTESERSINLKGGFTGSIPYQNSADETVFLQPGQSGQVLITSGSLTPIWKSILPVPTAGTGLIINQSVSNDINDYTISSIDNRLIDMQDNLLVRPKIKNYSLFHSSLGNISGTVVLNLENSNYFSANIVGNTTFQITNAPSSGGFILELTNGGSFVVNWPTSVNWTYRITPKLSVNATDVLVFVTRNSGTTWRSVLSIGNTII